MLDISRSTLSMYELGSRPLPPEIIAKAYALKQNFNVPATPNVLLDAALAQDRAADRAEIIAMKQGLVEKILYLESRLAILTRERDHLYNKLHALNSISGDVNELSMAAQNAVIQAIRTIESKINKELKWELESARALVMACDRMLESS